MSILRLVQVSAASAQAAIDTASAAPDPDANIMRAGVLQFLLVHAFRVVAEGTDLDLVDAYRAWLNIAVEVYGKGDAARIPDYIRQGGLFNAELQLAEARARGDLATTATAQPRAA